MFESPKRTTTPEYFHVQGGRPTGSERDRSRQSQPPGSAGSAGGLRASQGAGQSLETVERGGRPASLFMAAGQFSDNIGAARPGPIPSAVALAATVLLWP